MTHAHAEVAKNTKIAAESSKKYQKSHKFVAFFVYILTFWRNCVKIYLLRGRKTMTYETYKQSPYQLFLSDYQALLNDEYPAKYRAQIESYEDSMRKIESISDEDYILFLQTYAKRLFKASEVLTSAKIQGDKHALTISDGFRYKISIEFPKTDGTSPIGYRISQLKVYNAALPPTREKYISADTRIESGLYALEDEMCSKRLESERDHTFESSWRKYLNPETEQQ